MGSGFVPHQDLGLWEPESGEIVHNMFKHANGRDIFKT